MISPPVSGYSYARPRPSRPAAQATAGPLPPWGWIEWSLIIQAMLPVVLFIPGASSLRLLTRVGSFVIALVAWIGVYSSSRRAAPDRVPFRPIPWLTACTVWLLLSVFHPTTNSFASGLAQAAMYVTVFSPVFWVSGALISSRQISRIMLIVFVTNAISALMGIGQIYRPNIFNPPKIPIFDGGNEIAIASVTYVTDDGRKIIRPCGLSDNPGQAAGAGAVVCLIGLCLAVQPIGLFKRLIYLGLALAGMAAIYFCQIRAALVMEFVCVIALIGLFSMRGHFRQASLLAIGSVILVIGGASWVVSAVGEAGIRRFFTLIDERPDKLYQGARGGFVSHTFNTLIWEYPLGAGMGRWGQAYGYFGDHSPPTGSDNGQLWAEVQWPAWVIDGGIPLAVLYVIAMALAMLDTLRVVMSTKSKELTYWGATIWAMSLSIVALTFSSCPFVANTGITFWLLSAVLHSANQRVMPTSRPRQIRLRPQPTMA
jgi:hypothetical protein